MQAPASLDIVIPAYKARFLPALLSSLVKQTSKNFSVIVSDDASPDDLLAVCNQFNGRLPIRYVRFEQNLGATDLAAQWNRSVSLSSAQWALLPGDDDVLEENCVESFWKTVAQCGADYGMFAFGVRVIDANDRIIRNSIRPAHTRSAAKYIRERFAYEVYAVPAAHVFSRQLFDELGGFVSFDHGWHSDDATVALFAATGGIKPIENAYIRWRVSDISISSTFSKNYFQTANTALAFLCWVSDNRRRLGLSDSDLRQLTDDSISWPIYYAMARAPHEGWLAAAWRLSRQLQAYSFNSPSRHMFRLVRARITARQERHIDATK